MEGGRRLAGTGAHRGREHPDCDARLLGVLWSQLSQGCFASIEMALNGAGGQLGIFKKGRMQQGLRICKAVKHHCFFKKKKKKRKKTYCLQDRWLKFRPGYHHLGHSAGDSAPGSLSWLTCQAGIHGALHGVFKGLTRTTHTRCVFQYLVCGKPMVKCGRYYYCCCCCHGNSLLSLYAWKWEKIWLSSHLP